MAEKDYPPAFPRHHRSFGNNDMDLRDWFAGQALVGICAHPDTWGIQTVEGFAMQAYHLAEAMLAERARHG